jgi:hypothetical protein
VRESAFDPRIFPVGAHRMHAPICSVLCPDALARRTVPRLLRSRFDRQLVRHWAMRAASNVIGRGTKDDAGAEFRVVRSRGPLRPDPREIPRSPDQGCLLSITPDRRELSDPRTKSSQCCGRFPIHWRARPILSSGAESSLCDFCNDLYFFRVGHSRGRIFCCHVEQ